jgi:hypothetical protein
MYIMEIMWRYAVISGLWCTFDLCSDFFLHDGEPRDPHLPAVRTSRKRKADSLPIPAIYVEDSLHSIAAGDFVACKDKVMPNRGERGCVKGNSVVVETSGTSTTMLVYMHAYLSLIINLIYIILYFVCYYILCAITDVPFCFSFLFVECNIYLQTK